MTRTELFAAIKKADGDLSLETLRGHAEAHREALKMYQASGEQHSAQTCRQHLHWILNQVDWMTATNAR